MNTSPRVAALVMLTVFANGCHRAPPGVPDSGPRPEPAATPPSQPAPLPTDTGPAVVDAAVQATGNATAVQLPGATLRLLPGGAIRLEAHDRWGGDASTTFESVAYLERALPSLARSLAPETFAALRAWANAQRDGGPPGG